MNLCNLKRTFALKPQRGWDTMYVLVDVHGTIIPGSWHTKNDFRFISEDCKEVLQWMTKRKDFRIIIWTSSTGDEIVGIIQWLASHNIFIDYHNGNPEVRDTEYACFDYKPYFNILIDDKAGFEPERDWAELKCQLIELGEWDKI